MPWKFDETHHFRIEGTVHGAFTYRNKYNGDYEPQRGYVVLCAGVQIIRDAPDAQVTTDPITCLACLALD